MLPVLKLPRRLWLRWLRRLFFLYYSFPVLLWQLGLPLLLKPLISLLLLQSLLPFGAGSGKALCPRVHAMRSRIWPTPVGSGNMVQRQWWLLNGMQEYSWATLNPKRLLDRPYIEQGDLPLLQTAAAALLLLLLLLPHAAATATTTTTLATTALRRRPRLYREDLAARAPCSL